MSAGKAAVEAGAEAANSVGELIASHVIASSKHETVATTFHNSNGRHTYNGSKKAIGMIECKADQPQGGQRCRPQVSRRHYERLGENRQWY